MTVIQRKVLTIMEIALKDKTELFCINSNQFHPKATKTVQKLIKKIKINFRLLMILSIAVMWQASKFWFCNRDSIVIFWVLNQKFNYSESFVLQALNWLIGISNMMALLPITSSPLYFIFVLFHVELDQIGLCGYVYQFKDECKIKNQNEEFEYFVMNQLKCITEKGIKIKR